MCRQFCEFCMEERDCTYQEKMVHKIIDGIDIEFLEKFYICNSCNNKIFGDYFDENIRTANNELRKHTGLITVNEIKEFMRGEIMEDNFLEDLEQGVYKSLNKEGIDKVVKIIKEKEYVIDEFEKWLVDDLKEIYRDAGARHNIIVEVLDKLQELKGE